MEKKAINVRLRTDQWDALGKLADKNPEADRSKLIRQAVDEFLKKAKRQRNGNGARR